VCTSEGLGRLVYRLDTRRDDGEDPFDLRITGAELGRVESEQGERLGKDAQMLRAPGARQSHSDLVRLLVTAVIPQGRETLGVAFAGDNRPDDALPGEAGEVAERLG
jgi:hypothetical protein